MNKTKTLKKLLSVALVLMMVLSTMVIMPLTASAGNCTESGTAAVTPSGDGSSETPFLVGSHAEWKGLANIAESGTFWNQECHVKITADFELGHACALDSSSYPNCNPEDGPDDNTTPDWNAGSIKWNIDGQGHTISKTIVQLIMGTCGGVTIKNLNVVMNQTNAEAYGAAFIGVVSGNANGEVLIENCTVSGVMNYKRGGERVAGGIVGNIYNGTPMVTIKNCVNDAKIYNSDNVAQPFGGIVGGIEAGSLTIENCTNNGEVISKGGLAGGILGRLKAGTVEINNCINNGAISGGAQNAAIIASVADGKKPTITNCYNSGAIQGEDLPYSGTTAPTVNNDEKTLDEVRAMITMPRKDAQTSAAWAGSVDDFDIAKVTGFALPALANPELPNSAENPYMIYTPEELAYFSQHNRIKQDSNGDGVQDVNSSNNPLWTIKAPTAERWLKLGANIDLNGVAWLGMHANGNTLHLDGDNYTIKNLFANQYSAGFFASATGIKVDVSNLHFSDAFVAGGSGAGAMMAYAGGSAVVKFTNVTIDASSVVSTDRAAGNKTAGFIGEDYGSSSASITIDRCIMAATVKGSGTAELGGFLGKNVATNAQNRVITNSIMEGRIVATAPASATVGSLMSSAAGAYAFTNVYVVCSTMVNDNYINAKNRTATISNLQSVSFEDTAAVDEIKAMGLDKIEVPSTVGGKRATRLKVTDDFGFMAMADMPSGVSIYNPYLKNVSYGMLVMQAETATPEELAENGTLVHAENYTAGTNQICAAYTDITVATMDEDYVYAFCLLMDGVVASVSNIVYEINCYDWATQLAVDGTYEGTAVTNVETEIELYGAMVAYCDKYNAYLQYVNEQ